jgi:hypothetical protein
MTFQYFIGTIIFAFEMDFCVMVLLDGLFGLFYRPIGDRYLKVVVKNDGVLNY